MKRFTAFLLSLLTVLSLLSGGHFGSFAEDGDAVPTIVVSEVLAEPGDIVDLIISLENNPGIICLSFDLAYAEELSILEIDPYNDEGKLLFSEPGASAVWYTEMPGTNPDTYQKNPKRLSWGADLAPRNITVNGKIVRIRFKVSEDAEIGKLYPVSVSYDNTKSMIFNYNLKRVNFAVQNAGIQVECFHKNTETTPGNPSTCVLQGYSDRIVCTDCGAVVQENEPLPLLDHAYVERIVPPTALSKGYTRHTCEVCGDSYDDSFLPRLDDGKGDVNGDGVVNIEDVAALLGLLAQPENVPVPEGDMNGDGALTVKDVSRLLHLLEEE